LKIQNNPSPSFFVFLAKQAGHSAEVIKTMKFEVVYHNQLNEIEAMSREEAWEILQAWLSEEIELIEKKNFSKSCGA